MNERNNPGARTRDRRDRREARPSEGLAAILRQAPILIAFVVCGLIFFLGMGLRGCASPAEEQSSEPRTDSSVPGETPAPVRSSEETLPPESTPAGSSEPVGTEAVSTEPVTTEAPTTVPPTTEPPGPTMMTVDDRYFSDALFLGDSRTDGLFLYSTPGDCKHYPFPATSLTIFKVMDCKDEENRYGCASLRDLLKTYQFGKIYIMFGINEVGYSTSSFAQKYKEVLDELRSYQPDALIYIQSICYVTQKHEAQYPVFATANIKEKNEAIRVLANDVDIFYLEVNDCLNDGTDHLPSDYTGDGAHLKASKYAIWHDYLLEHAVVDAKHPWEPLSPEPSDTESQQP